MRIQTLVPCALAAALASGCPEDPPADDDSLPDEIPPDWFEQSGGTITNEMTYDQGALAGQTCTETFDIDGVNVTSIQPDDCEACDVVYSVYITLREETDCPGGDDLADQGELGFELMQATSEAVMWWYVEGWWSEEWTSLGTGTLVRDDEAMLFHFAFGFDDPGNDDALANWTTGDPCSWGDPCHWTGAYDMVMNLPFEVP